MIGFHVVSLDVTHAIEQSLYGGTIRPRFAPESFIDFNQFLETRNSEKQVDSYALLKH